MGKVFVHQSVGNIPTVHNQIGALAALIACRRARRAGRQEQATKLILSKEASVRVAWVFGPSRMMHRS
jgi:hypothetical protein